MGNSRTIARACLLVLLAGAALWPVVKCNFIWDDDRYITQNSQLRTPRGLENIWFHPLTAEVQYYPLTHTSFWIEYHLWGANPVGYHLDNLLLHAASVLVLWRILIKLKIPGAWAAAALFAIHPMQVESVAWATERKNVLSGLLYLLALRAYLEFLDRRTRGFYAAAIGLFLGALLAKTVASTLPAAILIIIWYRNGKIGWRDVLPLTPMLALGAILGSLTAYMERYIVGAIGPDFAFTPLDRLCIAGRAFWFYLGKLFQPVHLMFIYPRWTMNFAQRPWLILFPILAVGLLAALYLLRNRWGRGPMSAILFYAVTLIPAMGFTNVYPMRFSFVADHFQYLAGIGPLVLAAAMITRFVPRPAAMGIAGIALGVLATESYFRCAIFHDPLTLWANTVAVNPNSPMVHVNYAAALRDAGDVDQSLAEYHRALFLGADFNSDIGIGTCYFKREDYFTAIDWYNNALARMPESNQSRQHPMRALPYFMIANAYLAMADRADAYRHLAIDNYQKAIEIDPHFTDARRNLAKMLTDDGRPQEAEAQCQAILNDDPDSIPARNNLAYAFVHEGRIGDAIAQYQEVLRLDPNNDVARSNLMRIQQNPIQSQP